jgi:hypothetical protein
MCFSVVPARVLVLSGSWTAWPVGSRERRKNGERDRNYSSNSSATSSRSASKHTLLTVDVEISSYLCFVLCVGV